MKNSHWVLPDTVENKYEFEDEKFLVLFDCGDMHVCVWNFDSKLWEVQAGETTVKVVDTAVAVMHLPDPPTWV